MLKRYLCYIYTPRTSVYVYIDPALYSIKVRIYAVYPKNSSISSIAFSCYRSTGYLKVYILPTALILYPQPTQINQTIEAQITEAPNLHNLQLLVTRELRLPNIPLSFLSGFFFFLIPVNAEYKFQYTSKCITLRLLVKLGLKGRNV